MCRKEKGHKRRRVDTEVHSFEGAPVLAVRFNSLNEIVWGGNMGFKGNLPLQAGDDVAPDYALFRREELDCCVVEIVGPSDDLIVMTPQHAFRVSDIDTPIDCMRCPIRGIAKHFLPHHVCVAGERSVLRHVLGKTGRSGITERHAETEGR